MDRQQQNGEILGFMRPPCLLCLCKATLYIYHHSLNNIEFVQLELSVVILNQPASSQMLTGLHLYLFF